MLRSLILILLSLFLLSCASISSLEKAEKAEPVDEKAMPSTMTISMLGGEILNPNGLGESTSVEFQLFELQDDSMFLAADFTQLIEDHVKALKSNFVKVYDFALLPKQFKYVNPIEIDSKTNYIAVVARFVDPEISQWRKIVKISNKRYQYHLLIHLENYNVRLSGVF